MPDEHAPFSPSALEHQRHCSNYDGGKSESEASSRGTRIHWHIENQTPENCIDDAEFERPMRSAVAYAREVVLPWLANQIGMAKPEHEVRLQTPDTDCWGTGDLILEFGPNAILCDWKTGFGKRPIAKDCLQLAIYAIAMAFMRPWLKSIRAVLAELDQEFFTHHEFDAEWLRSTAWPEVQRVIERVRQRRDIMAGAHCRYCTHAPRCPALQRAINSLDMRTGIDDLEIADIEAALDRMDMVKAWIGAVQDRGYSLARMHALPNWGLEEGRRSRVWKDQQAAAIAIERAAQIKAEKAEGFEFDAFEPRSLKSPAVVEKAVGKSKAVRSILGPQITEKPGREKLARKGKT